MGHEDLRDLIAASELHDRFNRLKRGAIYKPEMVEKALTGFSKGRETPT
jgi:hypothetical protein